MPSEQHCVAFVKVDEASTSESRSPMHSEKEKPEESDAVCTGSDASGHTVASGNSFLPGVSQRSAAPCSTRGSIMSIVSEGAVHTSKKGPEVSAHSTDSSTSLNSSGSHYSSFSTNSASGYTCNTDSSLQKAVQRMAKDPVACLKRPTTPSTATVSARTLPSPEEPVSWSRLRHQLNRRIEEALKRPPAIVDPGRVIKSSSTDDFTEAPNICLSARAFTPDTSSARSPATSPGNTSAISSPEESQVARAQHLIEYVLRNLHHMEEVASIKVHFNHSLPPI